MLCIFTNDRLSLLWQFIQRSFQKTGGGVNGRKVVFFSRRGSYARWQVCMGEPLRDAWSPAVTAPPPNARTRVKDGEGLSVETPEVITRTVLQLASANKTAKESIIISQAPVVRFQRPGHAYPTREAFYRFISKLYSSGFTVKMITIFGTVRIQIPLFYVTCTLDIGLHFVRRKIIFQTKKCWKYHRTSSWAIH